MKIDKINQEVKEPMESPLRLKDFNGLANLHEQTTKELETLASIIRHNIETETGKMTQTIEITSDEKNITIKVNIDKLIHAINHHPEIQGQYKVDNKDTFVFELIDYLTNDSIHEINSPIEHLLDEASVAIVECGTDSFIEIGDDND